MDNSPSICNEPSFHVEREIFSQNLDVFDSRFKSKNNLLKSRSPSLVVRTEENLETTTEELSDVINTENASIPSAVGRNIILTRKRSIVIKRKRQMDTTMPQNAINSLNPRQMKDVDFEKVANLL